MKRNSAYSGGCFTSVPAASVHDESPGSETAELSLEEIIQITKEAILELPPCLTTPAALAFRARVEREVREIIAQGLIPELPFE
jgi:hypothetical protein